VTDRYRQHLEVETPEHVVLDYEVAGLGSRALAAMVDMGLVTILIVSESLLGLLLARSLSPLVMGVMVLVMFASVWGYFTLFEGLSEGQTPGKRWLGLRVIRDTGHPVTFRDAAARNLLRLADYLPPPYVLGGILVALHPQAKRLGDMVAGTVVVRDRPVESLARATEPEEREVVVAGSPLLSDDEFRLLREYTARAPSLPADVRERVAASLVERFAARVPGRHTGGDEFLRELAWNEEARRRGRFGGRAIASRGDASGRFATSSAIAERLVAQKSERWRAFDALTGRVSTGGLDSLGAAELPAFAAGYREVAADLARARTYGADFSIRFRLERLVAAGHNLLYRAPRQTWPAIWRFFAVDAPSAVVEARRAVLIAFVAFAVPAATGYLALRQRPELAKDALPTTLLERAEEGIARKAQGKGYAEVEAEGRPFVASSIITNNVQVAFTCFAGGIFLALGSILSLAFNGLLLGAVSGHYQNVGLLDYLWTFVAGHGVLELFAIWCAGAAGLLLGSAIVRPGAYSRRDALVINGRLAMRLVGLTVILLLVAGGIEGFVSTSRATPAIKVAVSVASALALAAYVAAGTRRAAPRGDRTLSAI
jgi:uncharacterized membrane protein SpoIIM required for sporulation/uncharacterized RDD family membrane protein YckC